MNPQRRIFINTTAQYVKAFINICLSLYTVRLILNILGQSDYGIYSLIASVVSMLGFITNAMVVTTQRYLSFYAGKGTKEDVRVIFSNSLILHVCIGLCLTLVLLSLKNFLCYGFFNISEARKPTAEIVYIMSTMMLFITFLAAPFKAMLIAHENIVYISIIEILDGVLKLTLALSLLTLGHDKLLLYACVMTIIFLFEFFAFSIYSVINFPECQILSIFHDFDKNKIKELFGFAGWTTYGMCSIVGRTQGLAVLFNKFFGTVINAAYGLALQVNGSVTFIATSLINAMNPQLMQAEGSNDRKKMIHLAEQESKFSSAIIFVILIPLAVEMDCVLNIWLVNVPPFTSFFCRSLILAFIFDQLTYGLNSANQALGNIKYYTLIMYTPKLLIIPLALIMLWAGIQVAWVMFLYIVVEFSVAMTRLFYMKKVIGLSIKQFSKNVFLRLLPLCSASFIVPLIIRFSFNGEYRFIFNLAISFLLGLLVMWHITLTKGERNVVLDTLYKLKERIGK